MAIQNDEEEMIDFFRSLGVTSEENEKSHDSERLSHVMEEDYAER